MDSTRKQELREFVARYQVCWQVFPEWLAGRNQKTEQIGFRLELYGVHPPGCHPTPGCELCQQVYVRLREVATFIRPHAQLEAREEVLSFDFSLHYTAAVHSPPFVQLAIRILHKNSFDRPVDQGEVHSLQELKTRLRELGATCGVPTGGASKARTAESVR